MPVWGKENHLTPKSQLGKLCVSTRFSLQQSVPAGSSHSTPSSACPNQGSTETSLTVKRSNYTKILKATEQDRPGQDGRRNFPIRWTYAKG